MLLTILPESDRRNFPHQGIGCDTLQVEQDPIDQEENHNILVVAEAPPTLSNHRHILNGKTNKKNTQKKNPNKKKEFKCLVHKKNLKGIFHPAVRSRWILHFSFSPTQLKTYKIFRSCNFFLQKKIAFRELIFIYTTWISTKSQQIFKILFASLHLKPQMHWDKSQFELRNPEINLGFLD